MSILVVDAFTCILFRAFLFLVSREHVFMLFPAQSWEHTVYAQVLFSRVCRSRGLYVGLCIFRVVKLEAQEVALSLHVGCLLIFVLCCFVFPVVRKSMDRDDACQQAHFLSIQARVSSMQGHRASFPPTRGACDVARSTAWPPFASLRVNRSARLSALSRQDSLISTFLFLW